nr:RluA family pseudouridine synthase [uncultured Bacillus sp.]
MPLFSLQWTIETKDAGKLVREYLKEQHISKTALTDIKFKGGSITVNNGTVTVRYRLKQGDRLNITFPAEEPADGIQAENISLNILYEDEYILVVNKPSRMNTIPSREHPAGSLANALLGYYEKIGLRATAHIVTRLDRDTSGLVLIAKHRHTHHLLSEQQRSGKVKRTYEAFAAGIFSHEKGRIVQPIGRKSDSIIERMVREDGQYAVTNFAVKKCLSNFTWVELQLETGRTHQIRVHLSYIGHPLLGDDLYGGSLDKITRQALHCRKISFLHPYDKRRCEFTAELLDDMKALADHQEM